MYVSTKLTKSYLTEWVSLPRWMGIFSIALQKHTKQRNKQKNVLACKIVNSSKAYDCVCAHSVSRVLLFANSWTVAHQDPLSM